MRGPSRSSATPPSGESLSRDDRHGSGPYALAHPLRREDGRTGRDGAVINTWSLKLFRLGFPKDTIMTTIGRLVADPLPGFGGRLAAALPRQGQQARCACAGHVGRPVLQPGPAAERLCVRAHGSATWSSTSSTSTPAGSCSARSCSTSPADLAPLNPSRSSGRALWRPRKAVRRTMQGTPRGAPPRAERSRRASSALWPLAARRA